MPPELCLSYDLCKCPSVIALALCCHNVAVESVLDLISASFIPRRTMRPQSSVYLMFLAGVSVITVVLCCHYVAGVSAHDLMFASFSSHFTDGTRFHLWLRAAWVHAAASERLAWSKFLTGGLFLSWLSAALFVSLSSSVVANSCCCECHLLRLRECSYTRSDAPCSLCAKVRRAGGEERDGKGWAEGGVGLRRGTRRREEGKVGSRCLPGGMVVVGCEGASGDDKVTFLNDGARPGDFMSSCSFLCSAPKVRRKVHAAMVAALEAAVGRLSAQRQQEAEQRTAGLPAVIPSGASVCMHGATVN